MLKKISYLIGFLVCLGIALSLLDAKDDYAAQRRLYSADRLFNQILKNPAVNPPGLYENNATLYKKIITEFSKTQGERQARLHLGELYILAKKFNEARKNLEEALKAYPEDKNYRAQVKFVIARSHEKEGKWQEALAIYEKIMQDYSGTPTALNTPIYIIDYYERRRDAADKVAYMEKALNYYRKLSKENPDTSLGYLAMNYEVTTLQYANNWEGVLNGLESLINNYPNNYNLLSNLTDLEMVGILKLQNPQRVINIYSEFLKKHPRHKFTNLITKKIEAIKNVIEAKDNANKPVKQTKPQK